MRKQTVCGFLAFLILLSPLTCLSVFAESSDTERQVLSVAEDIINWKKTDNGSTPEGDLINNTFLELAGSTPGDWFPIGLGRLEISDNYDGYLAVIRDRVEERYQESGKLSAAKATEWHRISLAILAMGGDPTAFGKDAEGNAINLIADGTYNRGKTTPLGRQGINGWIWGLITLDSKRYAVPSDAYYTRDDIILEIIRQQLTDGGFALSGKDADPDITAMALQALAPYYNSEKVYTYTQKSIGNDVQKTVRQIVDEALQCLSQLQLNTGDYKSWGTQNVESTDQVIVALCCLGIDPLSDSRFIKNGKTLLDGVLRYKMTDGGFIHSFSYDPDNPTSLPDQSNTMASEQTLYTMAALWRQMSGKRTLYDFRSEQSNALKKRISALEYDISAIEKTTSTSALTDLLVSYYSIPENERDYVRNYPTLSDAAKAVHIDIEAIANETPVVESPSDELGESVLFTFSASDRAAVDALPEKLTTEQYVMVTTLLDKLRQSQDFEEKNQYLDKLISAKEKIAKVQAEIDSLNADIQSKLYPFDSITLKDKNTVDDIVNRYGALSAYDQSKIERFEDVIKTKTKLDNLVRSIWIAIALGLITLTTTALLVVRIQKRRKKKQAAMDELAAQYSDEDE